MKEEAKELDEIVSVLKALTEHRTRWQINDGCIYIKTCVRGKGTLEMPVLLSRETQASLGEIVRKFYVKSLLARGEALCEIINQDYGRAIQELNQARENIEPNCE